MMLFRLLAICVTLVVLSPALGASAAEDPSTKAVVCKLHASLPGWRDIAEQSAALAQEATGVPKTILSALHDSLKGSADIIAAIPDVTVLSREGLYQLNQNFVIAPVQIENTLATTSAQYPDFTRQFKTQLDEIKATAAQITKAISEC